MKLFIEHADKKCVLLFKPRSTCYSVNKFGLKHQNFRMKQIFNVFQIYYTAKFHDKEQ